MILKLREVFTMKTKVFFDTFKGHKLFAVWEVDDQGQKVGQYPLFSLGSKKSMALANHLEEFKDYVTTCKAENTKGSKHE